MPVFLSDDDLEELSNIIDVIPHKQAVSIMKFINSRIKKTMPRENISNASISEAVTKEQQTPVT